MHQAVSQLGLGLGRGVHQAVSQPSHRRVSTASRFCRRGGSPLTSPRSAPRSAASCASPMTSPQHHWQQSCSPSASIGQPRLPRSTKSERWPRHSGTCSRGVARGGATLQLGRRAAQAGRAARRRGSSPPAAAAASPLSSPRRAAARRAAARRAAAPCASPLTRQRSPATGTAGQAAGHPLHLLRHRWPPAAGAALKLR